MQHSKFGLRVSGAVNTSQHPALEIMKKVSLAEAKAAKRKELEEQAQLRAGVIRGNGSSGSKKNKIVRERSASPTKVTPSTTRKVKTIRESSQSPTPSLASFTPRAITPPPIAYSTSQFVGMSPGVTKKKEATPAAGDNDITFSQPSIFASTGNTPSRRTKRASTPKRTPKKIREEYTVKDSNEDGYVNVVDLDGDDIFTKLRNANKCQVRTTNEVFDNNDSFSSKRSIVRGSLVSSPLFYIAIVAAVISTIIAFNGEELLAFVGGKSASPVVFCDNAGASAVAHNDYPNECIPCPDHGVCSNGLLYDCTGGSQWVLSQDLKRCVMDVEFDSLAAQLYSEFAQYVSDFIMSTIR